MSNLDTMPDVTACGGDQADGPVRDLLTGRIATVGGTELRRLLPNLGRRMVGAWCFVDHYGPQDIAREAGMLVPPHPHTGLQTVSWLHDGEIHHRDSLGSSQLIRPGTLGLMTAGRAIAHAEQTPAAHGPVLHGAQLWVALPDEHRHVEPHFEHHDDLPVVTGGGISARVILGGVDGASSPGTTYTPLVGADLSLSAGADTKLPVEPEFEYAALSMSGSALVDGVTLEPGSLLYLGCGRRELPLRSDTGAGVMLLGGVPFEEQIVMWWNFIGRSTEEITQFRDEWMTGDTFGTVEYDGDPLPAPEMPPGQLKPRGRAR